VQLTLAPVEQAFTTVVVQLALQPLQRFLPKSTASPPAVKASINTAEYILETSSTKKGSQPTLKKTANPQDS
jgi:hypothetical protein